jgi:ribosomal protein L18E
MTQAETNWRTLLLAMVKSLRDMPDEARESVTKAINNAGKQSRRQRNRISARKIRYDLDEVERLAGIQV